MKIAKDGIIRNFLRAEVKHPFKHKYALTEPETRELLKDCGAFGIILLEYYFRLASNETIELDDDAMVAEHFGVEPETIARQRRKLINTGWYYSEMATSSSGTTKLKLYTLGKYGVGHRRSFTKTDHQQYQDQQRPDISLFE